MSSILCFLCSMWLAVTIAHAIVLDVEISVDISSAVPVKPLVLAANQAWIYFNARYDNPSVRKYIEDNRVDGIRWPAGGVGNFLDWKTGKAIPWAGYQNMSQDHMTIMQNSVDWTTEKLRTFRKSGNSPIDEMYAYSSWNGTLMIMVNVCGNTEESTRELAATLKARKMEPVVFELGNELALEKYNGCVPNGTAYAILARRHADAIRSEIPNARIGVPIPNIKYRYVTTPQWLTQRKRYKWNDEIRDAFNGDQSWFDAVVMHPYTTVGEENTDPLPEMFRTAANLADNRLGVVLEDVAEKFPRKKIWFTEWHIWGPRALRTQWFGGLFRAYFMMKMFLENSIEIGGFHSLSHSIRIPIERGVTFAEAYTDSQVEAIPSLEMALKIYGPIIREGCMGVTTITFSGQRFFGDKYPGESSELEGVYFVCGEKRGYAVMVNKLNGRYAVGMESTSFVSGYTLEAQDKTEWGEDVSRKDIGQEQLDQSRVLLEPYSIVVLELNL